MENLARVIAVNVSRRQLAPCVKVLSGAYRAAVQQGATFSVNMSFTYTSGGAHIGPIFSNQPVERQTFVQPRDAYFTRARGNLVDLPSEPDPGTQVVCSVTLQYPNTEGHNLDCGPSETTTFYPTIAV